MAVPFHTKQTNKQTNLAASSCKTELVRACMLDIRNGWTFHSATSRRQADLVIRTLKNALVWWYFYTRVISTLQGPFKIIWNICTK